MAFDDRNIQWSRLGEGPVFDHLVVHALSVDEERNIVDFLAKFEANEKIVLHRHLGDTNTFVVDGEHILYEPGTQEVREVRPVGHAKSSPAGDYHHEGGGADGAVVHYSVRSDSDALFDILNEDMTVIVTLRTSDVKALMAAQTAPA